jgi:hypothetical protein
VSRDVPRPVLDTEEEWIFRHEHIGAVEDVLIAVAGPDEEVVLRSAADDERRLTAR